MTTTRILALDFGTRCGWALADTAEGWRESGTWDLAPARQRRYEGGGMRWVRLRQYLDGLGPIDRVVFEEVRRHAGTDAAHVYGGALAVVTEWCESRSIPYEGIPVATIKRHATGKGNAKKDAMMEAARARGWSPADDNEADALWILDLALSEVAS